MTSTHRYETRVEAVIFWESETRSSLSTNRQAPLSHCSTFYRQVGCGLSTPRPKMMAIWQATHIPTARSHDLTHYTTPADKPRHTQDKTLTSHHLWKVADNEYKCSCAVQINLSVSLRPSSSPSCKQSCTVWLRAYFMAKFAAPRRSGESVTGPSDF